MGLPIVENVSGLQESVFSLSRGPQLHFGEPSKNGSYFIKFTDFRLFPLFGVPWAAVILKVCQSKKSWQARHTGIKIVQQIAILMVCP